MRTDYAICMDPASNPTTPTDKLPLDNKEKVIEMPQVVLPDRIRLPQEEEDEE